VQQLVEEGCGGRGGADGRHRDALDARPANRAALLSEGHGAALEVPRHRTQRAKPLHAQNNIVPCQHHDEQVGAEDVALDGERGTAQNARAGDLLTGSHRRRHAWLGGDGQPGAARGSLRDEAV